MSILPLFAQTTLPVVDTGGGVDPLVITFVLVGVMTIAALVWVLRRPSDFDDIERPHR